MATARRTHSILPPLVDCCRSRFRMQVWGPTDWSSSRSSSIPCDSSSSITVCAYDLACIRNHSGWTACTLTDT